jgi:hypothetical protein
MKKHFKLYLTVQILFSSFLLQAQQKVRWDYPIKPGTEQWKEFQTHDEMLKACQIPEETLKELKTDELIEIMLDYPLIGDVLAFNSLEQGMGRVKGRFNGFTGLLSRKDALEYLLSKYDSTDPTRASLLKEREKRGEFKYKMRFLELFIAQDEMKEQWDEKTSKSFLKKMLKNRDTQKSQGKWDDVPMAYSISKILKNTDAKDEIENKKATFSKFVETSNPSKMQDLEQIFLIAKKYAEK